MTNIFIDASVLAFPQAAPEEKDEFNNLEIFFRNIRRLKDLASNPMITITIKKDLKDWLKDNDYYLDYDKNRERINNFTGSRKNFTIPPREIAKIYGFFFEKYQALCVDIQKVEDAKDRLLSKEEYTVYLTNISERLIEEHENLVRYVAMLNKVYNKKEDRLVLVGTSKTNLSEVNEKIAKVLPVSVNIRGVKKASNDYEYHKKYKTPVEAYLAAKENLSQDKNIVFGQDIDKSTDSIITKMDYNSDDEIAADRLYAYLKSLSEVAEFCRINNIGIKDDNEFNNIVKSFGLDSVNDGSTYNDCPRRKWHCNDSCAQFTLHLRPTTEPEYSFSFICAKTVRVYYKLNDARQIIVGMICRHPPTHGKGGDHDKNKCMRGEYFSIGDIINNKRR
ncbi:hypothetical protein LQZ21_01520 [Treponema sp. TIM-1]|uniref:hypothetical protein n=1 Tax=Treponema sp. TIM-1 TaxID=2898417 RepID=UPI0039805C30